MFKRLTISLLLMGLAAFGLGAAAFAWFSTSETGNVSISSGSADIAITADRDCDDDDYAVIDGAAAPFVWEGIVPGQQTQDCFVVENTGDGTLDVYIKHQNFGGNAALRAAVHFTYVNDLGAVLCGGPATTEDFRVTGANGERGCYLGTIAEDETLEFEARVELPESGSNQNTLQNRTFNMNAVVSGYTG